MPIVSSTYTLDGHQQADGRTYVTERHLDQLGTEYAATYLAAPGADYAGIMAARATQISDDLAAQEIDGVLNGA